MTRDSSSNSVTFSHLKSYTFVQCVRQTELIRELLMEKKADDDVSSNKETLWNDSFSDSHSHSHSHFDEEAPLMYSSRISHLGRKPA
uniref:Uncharacterized protein n=1 Tax=Medicago truncatula TaxID=3880 RepID=A4PU37_MEDTR|nr:hypothetical protein MtrDRAFT_AC144563g43v2 [Medicago truncatula]